MSTFDYNKITYDEFNYALSEILDEMTGEQIMMIPGVYEVVSEELNNEALDLAVAKFYGFKREGADHE